MRNFLLFICLSVLVLTSCSESGMTQDYVIESPLIANDISNQKVSSFAEDVNGHIWIGTFRGLNRFNVHEYHQHFCTDEENSLPDNQIQCLFRDSKGRLWVSTVNGMALYTEQDSFKRIPMETISRNSVQIMEDRTGKIYINTSIHLCVYDEEDGIFREVLQLVDGKTTAARQCFFAPDNELWVTDPISIKRYDSATMQLKDSVALDGYPGYFNMLEDGKLWMSSHTGVSVFDLNSKTFLNLPNVFRKHPSFQGTQISHIYPF